MNKFEKFIKQFIPKGIGNISWFNHIPTRKIKARIQYWDFFQVHFLSLFSTQHILTHEVSRQHLTKTRVFKEKTQDFSVEFIHRDDAEFVEIAKEWVSIQQQIKNLQSLEENIKNKLLEVTNQQPTKCEWLKIFKIHRKGNINYSEIPELKNIDVEKYRKNPTNFWKISYELDRYQMSASSC